MGEKEWPNHRDFGENRYVKSAQTTDNLDVSASSDESGKIHRQSARNHVDGRTTNDLVGIEVDAGKGMEQREQRSCNHGHQKTNPNGNRIPSQHPLQAKGGKW